MIDDLVSGDDVFFAATGITDGELLRGVRYWGEGAGTQSLVMRSKSGTIRIIEAQHRWTKLSAVLRRSVTRAERLPAVPVVQVCSRPASADEPRRAPWPR